MKRRILMVLSLALMLQSCLVKSLQPFYKKENLKFNRAFIGNWVDQKKGIWTVTSIEDKFKKDEDDGIKLSEEDLKARENYKKGYVITYIKNKKEAEFIGMPFLVGNQFFIDFTPISFEEEDINSLAAQHLLKTHSVAKMDIREGKIVLSWLSESRVEELLDSGQLRLKHENMGIEETLLLTASSEQLYKFLKKYLSLKLEDKWKASDILTLSKADEKP